MKIALQTGQKTFQQACAENGQDWKKVIDAMAEARQYGLDKGIELGGIIYGQKTENIEPRADPEEQPEPEPVAVPVPAAQGGQPEGAEPGH